MLPGSKRTPADALEAAAWWSARQRLGLLSDRDEEALKTWREDPAHEAAWKATEAPLEGIGAFASAPDIRAIRDAALRQRPSRLSLPKGWQGGAGIAACLATGMVWIAWTGTPPNGSGSSAAPATSARYVTRIGGHRDILLTDGSRVTLNTNSVLEVTFTTRRRDVRLLSGQALFRVAKDAGRPFVVSAGDRRITATGTAFDVRVADKGAVTVLLVEGHVVVDPIRPRGLARIIPALDRDEIEPGERFTAPSIGPVSIAAVDVKRGTSWSQGRIIFRDDRLVDAIAEMNRYSTMRIVIEDDRVAQIRISGVFGSDRADTFTTMLAAAYPIDARRRSPDVVSLRWKDRPPK